MTDTAEYWNDIKSHSNKIQIQFYHIPNVECGHHHYHDAKRLGDVNCYSCLKLIKSGLIHNLPEGKTISKSERKRLAIVKEAELKYGRCLICNSLLTPRNNKSLGKTFLGCTNYPKCKYTKSII